MDIEHAIDEFLAGAGHHSTIKRSVTICIILTIYPFNSSRLTIQLLLQCGDLGSGEPSAVDEVLLHRLIERRVCSRIDAAHVSQTIADAVTMTILVDVHFGGCLIVRSDIVPSGVA